MKPRFVIVVFLILALAVPVQMLAQQSKAEKEVRATLDQLSQAIVKGGAEAATMEDKLLADDFTLVNSSGAVFTKSEVMNAFRTGQFHYEAFDLSDVKIRIYGHTAIATGVLTQKSVGTLTGLQGQLVQTRFTRVFVKRGGDWQCVLYQHTRIVAPASAQAAPTNAPPSYVADPAVYKLIGENDQFVVIRGTWLVGQRDAWHSHMPLAAYQLTDCHGRFYTPDGTTTERTLKAGAVLLLPVVPSHSVENIGTAVCETLIVERK